MAIITPAPYLTFRSVEWILDRPAQVNLSGWTGKRTVVADPWHGLWRGKAEIAQVQGEANARALRAFLAKLKGQINTLELRAVVEAQHAQLGATITNRVNTTVTSLGGDVYRITKTGGVAATWDADAASSAQYTGDFVIRAQARQTNLDLMVAANTDPAADSSYTSLDRALHFKSDGTVQASENGVGGASLGAYTTSDYWFIRRSGAAVTALKGTSEDIDKASIVHTFTTLSGAVSFDSSFEDSNAEVDVMMTVTPTVASGGAAGATTLTLGTSLPPLTAGMMATVLLPSGNKQLVVLTQDISAGGVITFEPPMRESAAAGATVETRLPYALVALTDSRIGWATGPWRLFNVSLDVEEAI